MTARIWDPDEFRSEYGIRSLSKAHKAHPFEFDGSVVGYEPAESVVKLKGGNSNWRRATWFPTNFLLIESLRKLGTAFGDTLGVSDPWAGDSPIPSHGLARQIADRLVRIFTRGPDGRRAVFGPAGGSTRTRSGKIISYFMNIFTETTARGSGPRAGPGWTALVASLIDEWRH